MSSSTAALSMDDVSRAMREIRQARERCTLIVCCHPDDEQTVRATLAWNAVTDFCPPPVEVIVAEHATAGTVYSWPKYGPANPYSPGEGEPCDG